MPSALEFVVPVRQAVHEGPAARRCDFDLPRSSAKVEGVTGTYFANRKPQTSNKASYDHTAATRLWQVSAALVGLKASVQRPD
jgi:hypothetical protein